MASKDDLVKQSIYDLHNKSNKEIISQSLHVRNHFASDPKCRINQRFLYTNDKNVTDAAHFIPQHVLDVTTGLLATR